MKQERLSRRWWWWRGVQVLASTWIVCRAEGEPAVFPEYKPETAREYVRTVIQIVQNQPVIEAATCFILARIHNQLGDAGEAERLARQALKLEPNHPEIQSFVAGLLIHQDRMEEAADLLRQALALKPELAGGYGRFGMVLDRLGDREGARKAFETAIRQTPEDATARLLLGRLLLDQGQPKEAAAHLQKACQIDPGLANAYYVLAQAQIQIGDSETARTNLTTFQQLKRQERGGMDVVKRAFDDDKVMRVLAAGFHSEVGGLFSKQRRFDLAEAHLRQAIRIAPQEAQGYELLAALLVQTNRLSEAREVWEALVRLQPKQVAYRLNLGTVLLQLKEYPAAVEELRRVLDLNPQQEQALNNLARFYLGNKTDLPEALVLCRRLIDTQPTAANYSLLGWALYANGQLEEARTAAAKAVELDPANPVFRERNRRLQQVP